MGEWYKDENDVQVKALVGRTLAGLRDVRQQKAHTEKRAVTVPIRTLSLIASSTFLSGALSPLFPVESSGGPRPTSTALLSSAHAAGTARIIEESFLVEMPVQQDP